MGVWGAGLYSGDFAMDLRKTVGAVARLPFEPDRLVDILRETEPTAANDPADEEHTTFWLVVADQFARRGIVSGRVRDKALAILDAGDDAEMLRQLGMKPADIRRRQRLVDDIRIRLTAAVVPKPRTVLRKPQPLIMDRGDVIVYPTCAGRCINPYFASKDLVPHYTREGPRPWQQDGWAATVIVDCGRAFDFLSWYRPLTLAYARRDKPSIDTLRAGDDWRLESPGTCSPTHFRKMELEKIGSVPVDPERVRAAFGPLRPGISAAVSDISIANRLGAVPDAPRAAPAASARHGRPTAIASLDEILS
jgi:hypothetical protein